LAARNLLASREHFRRSYSLPLRALGRSATFAAQALLLLARLTNKDEELPLSLR
jgi:hypothetical protein